MPDKPGTKGSILGLTLLFLALFAVQMAVDPRFMPRVSDSLSGRIIRKVLLPPEPAPSVPEDPSTLHALRFDGRNFAISSGPAAGAVSLTELGRVLRTCTEGGSECVATLAPGPGALFSLSTNGGTGSDAASGCLTEVAGALTSLSMDRDHPVTGAERLLSCALKSPELLQYLATTMAHECPWDRDFLERISKAFLEQARFGRHYGRMRGPIFAYYSDLSRCAGSLGLPELAGVARYRAKALYDRLSWVSHQVTFGEYPGGIRLSPVLDAVDTGFDLGAIAGLSDPGERVNNSIRARAETLRSADPATMERHLAGAWIGELRLFLRDLSELRGQNEPALVKEVHARIFSRHPVADSDLEDAIVRFKLPVARSGAGHEARRSAVIRALRSGA